MMKVRKRMSNESKYYNEDVNKYCNYKKTGYDAFTEDDINKHNWKSTNKQLQIGNPWKYVDKQDCYAQDFALNNNNNNSNNNNNNNSENKSNKAETIEEKMQKKK